MNATADDTSKSARPSVIQLNIKEKAALYASYIPLFKEGGIFVPTQREYQMGDSIFVMLTLPDDPKKYAIAGTVAWITPAGASGGRTQGVGVRFPADEKSAELRTKIENRLGSALNSDRPTHTV
ncbi:pilus assembly protein PilZ [Vandammella animalimorsus]|uniref:Pilus assembly protein PilZ n=1 Tax=Vandammella animalimorsus TaxID=2029117 RepID=A0A2A2A8B0_9BURK|nr:PilZ domain-containing protein [Vandammella animalimorsus]PAT31607.1 pilus assembly protein PilZ [Vandammella animalimorsus]PAT33978.1 pilus assembly protein PilZ [Vandammella animalimorsus]PAT41798.1 pilus assembly protein PilZ [Vandammella animalimorsus]PAX16166.1 pilus assembly protein PilZ [Vandammella animalimorsus]PAX18196.1 pilus assembly protein PilZ [Vandammella animalimorsus]